VQVGQLTQWTSEFVGDSAQPAATARISYWDWGAEKLSGYFVFRLIPPRPTFDVDMNDDERAIMQRHVVYWRAQVEAGTVVVYGPVRDSTGAWGLGVFEAEDEESARAIATGDPAISSGMATIEFGPIQPGFIRES
jgi:uncharacterized protein YciI